MRVLAAAAAAAMMLAGCPGDRATAPPVEPQASVPASAPAADRDTCCGQCTAAASQDPTAADLALVPCADYAGHTVNGARVMTDACAGWFAQRPAMVQDCR